MRVMLAKGKGKTYMKLREYCVMGIGLLVIALVAVAVVPKTTQNVVRAQKFELIDENGRLCASLGLTKDGSPSFVLQDASGTARVEVLLASDGCPVVVIRDKNGKSRAALTASPAGNAGLVFLDKDEKEKASFGLDFDGTPKLDVRDNQGKAENVLLSFVQ